MFSKLFRVYNTSRPLTKVEEEWRKFKIGDDIEYLGTKGKIVTIFDLYTSNEEDDDYWNGPAYIVMRYLNSIGEFKDIKLYEKDLFNKYSS